MARKLSLPILVTYSGRLNHYISLMGRVRSTVRMRWLTVGTKDALQVVRETNAVKLDRFGNSAHDALC